MKTTLLVLLILSLVLGLGGYAIWYSDPKSYQASIKGVYYQKEQEGIIEPVTLHFEGKLKNHWNGKSRLMGW